eukprot:gene3741-874_t
MVQQRRALDSAAVVELPYGAVVVAAEVAGRRARLTHPVEGWVSCRSATNGMCIIAQAAGAATTGGSSGPRRSGQALNLSILLAAVTGAA